MKIQTRYKGNRRFASGNEYTDAVMDAAADADGLAEAPSPKQMLLHSLAGCTGMDVVAILEKRGVKYKDFSIEVEGQQNNIHPKVFKTIDIIFTFTANPDDQTIIERAVALSKKQFCGISRMLSKTAEITTSVIIIPE